MKKAKIELIRTSQAINSGRNIEIYIDDSLKTKIANGAEKIMEVVPGNRTVFAKIDWCKSQKLLLNLEPGEKKKVICGSKLVGWKKSLTLFYLFSRNKYIYLEPYSKEQTIEYKEKTWSDISEEGMIKYIIKQGIIGWGIPVGIFSFMILTLLNYNQISFTNILLLALKNIGIFSIGGVFYGLIMWFLLNNINS